MLTDLTDYVTARVRKWRVVTQYLAAPCSTPFWAALKLAPRAATRPLIMLLSFGADDVARGALRPRAVYAQRKPIGRLGRALSRVFPELGEEIGRRIPRTEIIRGRSIGTPERILWIADGAIQRVGFWLLLADVVTEFSYRWVQLLRAERYCTRPDIRAGIIHSGLFKSHLGPLPWQHWDPWPTTTAPDPWHPHDPTRAFLSWDARPHYLYALWTLNNPTERPVQYQVAMAGNLGNTWTPDSLPWRQITVPEGTTRTVTTYGTVTAQTCTISCWIGPTYRDQPATIDFHYLLGGAPKFYPEQDP